MTKAEKAEALKEWRQVLKDHPKFAKAFLAQQAILMEASELGYHLIDVRMCKLLDELGIVVPFLEYWRERCKKVRVVEVGGILGCLSSSRDPADCFNLREDDWFDDPFAGGRTLPPKPPVPPL